MNKFILLAFGAALITTTALSQSAHQHHAAPTPNASTKAFEAANATMHKDMAIQFTGNADLDFVRGMIAHHQGAIDMAKVVLEHGKDAAIKKLAEEIIKAQTSEISMMKEWLAKNPN